MFTISEIANKISGEIIGDADSIIHGVCDIMQGQKKHISYISSKQYMPLFTKTQASALIVDKNFKLSKPDIALITVKNPLRSFIDIVNLFHPQEKIKASIDERASISKHSSIGQNVHIDANVVIEDNVIIGDNVRICVGSFIGKNSIIGNNTIIHPNVSIYNLELPQNVNSKHSTCSTTIKTNHRKQSFCN